MQSRARKSYVVQEPVQQYPMVGLTPT